MRNIRIQSSVTVMVALAFLFVSGVVNAQLPDFTELVEKNSPAVVNISTKKSSKVGKGMKHHPFNKMPEMPEIPEDSPLNDLFKHFFGGQPFDFEMPDQFDSESLGSGFIISADGYIMTNHHVVLDADEVIVRLSDRREFEAKIIGSDKASDVALIKIEATDLPTVKLGSGSDLKVGEWVLAIGSPFGFDHSVTAGIVSAKGRSLPEENYVPFIQTDVAINPGNSGGPLFNLEGEVVGINSQIYSRSGGFMGLSFAIPIEVAQNVVEQIRTTGKVSRGWLGVLIQDVTKALAESFGMDQPKGALVAKVLPDSPAEKAGVEAGDIIIRFNGKSVSKSTQLPPMVGSANIDKLAEVVVLRQGKEKTLSVNIGELPDDQLAGGSTGGQADKSTTLGLVVSDLTDEQRKKLSLSDGGVYVSKVLEGPAQAAGIRAGEAVVMLRNHRVEGVADFNDQLEKLPKDKPVAVLVQQQEGSRWITLTLPGE